MDIGRILIFMPLAVYCFYSFCKSKQDIYIILGTLGWYAAIYSGKNSIYQSLQGIPKSLIKLVTILLVVYMSVSYIRISIEKYKEYRK